MRTILKAVGAAVAGGLLAAGCASDPYYGDYGYGGVGYGATYGYGYDYPYDNGYYYGGPVVGGVISSDRYYYRDRDRGDWRNRDRRTWQQRRDEAAAEAAQPHGPGVEYNNEYERQNLENRARLLDGQKPSGAGG